MPLAGLSAHLAYAAPGLFQRQVIHCVGGGDHILLDHQAAVSFAPKISDTL